MFKEKGRKKVGRGYNSVSRKSFLELSFVVGNLYGFRQCQLHSCASIRNTSGATTQQLFSLAVEQSTALQMCIDDARHWGCFMADTRASIQRWKTRLCLCLIHEAGRSVRRSLPRGCILHGVDDKLSYKLSTSGMKMHYPIASCSNGGWC